MINNLNVSVLTNLKYLIKNPFFLSLIPFLLIIILFPKEFNRYVIETESSSMVEEGYYFWYYDLDNDGSSERFELMNTVNTTGLSIQNNQGIIDQWNFRGNFNFVKKKCLFIAGDKDNNGSKELYIFTLSNDSILLHCMSNMLDPSLEFKNRLIAITGHGIKNPDPFIIPAEMDDLDNDGVKELIFGIGSGFSIYPRNVYAYFISRDSLIISPESSYFIEDILQADINMDGKREIIPYGYASANVDPKNAKYHDQSSYLMVLDQHLKFLFEPIEFKVKYSNVSPFIKIADRGNSLAFLHTPVAINASSTLYSVNPKGIITDTVLLPFHIQKVQNALTQENEVSYYGIIPRQGLGLLNSNFELISILNHDESFRITVMDVDLDGEKEILLTEFETSKLYIYRNGFIHPVSVTVPFINRDDNYISLKTNPGSDPLIYLQSGQNSMFLKYRQNPYYPYYYAYYLTIYLSILGFALTITKIQKNQFKKRYDNEKKISELQLALVKNQMDPHFTLNVINSIIYSANHSGKEQVSDQLQKFANLYRNLVLSSGSSRRTLEEELSFCSDYLDLEKMRFGESFSYQIQIDNDVNKMILVPKMSIQIYLENAIKHGLSSMKSDGKLIIGLRNVGNVLQIEITDNGIGRKNALNQANNSTKMGTKLMDELYNIYNKYYKEKISSEIIDLYDKNDDPAGTKVLITILNK